MDTQPGFEECKRTLNQLVIQNLQIPPSDKIHLGTQVDQLPYSFDNLVQLINMAVGFGNTGAANQILSLSWKFEERKKELLMMRVKLAKEAGNLSLAVTLLTLALHTYPELSERDPNRHISQQQPWQLQQFKKLISSVGKRLVPFTLEDHDLDTLVLLEEGSRFAEDGAYSKAFEIYQAVFSKKCSDPLLFNTALILYALVQLNQSKEHGALACKLLLSCSEKFPKKPDAVFLAAKLCEMTGERPAADMSIDDLYHLAITLDPNHVEALEAIALRMQDAGQIRESFQYSTRAHRAREAVIQASPLACLNTRFIDSSALYAMGHLGPNVDRAIKELKLGLRDSSNVVILATEGEVANIPLLRYWRRHLPVITDPKTVDLLSPLKDELFFDLSFGTLQNRQIGNNRFSLPYIQQLWEQQNRPALLSLTGEDRAKGQKILQQLGLPTGAWFVALYVRDPFFKNERPGEYNSHRNAEVGSYLQMIEEVNARGGWVIRLGDRSAAPLPTDKNIRVIDYAKSPYKSEFMDVFLCATARFFIGCNGGLISTPPLFGVPVVGTNYPLTFLQYSSQDIFIPKLVRKRETGRYLSLKEIFSPPFFQSESSQVIKEHCLEFVDNSPEDLLHITLEMMERIEGKADYTAEDERLQNLYRSYAPAETGPSLARLGREFLRRYGSLLFPAE